MALENHRARGIADRGEQDHPRAKQRRPSLRRVDADQHHDAAHPHHQSNQARPAGALGPVKAQCQQSHQQGHGGNDDCRQRGCHALLAGSDQRKRNRDLGNRVGQQPPPVPAKRTERSRARGPRQQHQRPQYDPPPRQQAGRHAAVYGELDEEVGNPPYQRQSGEDRPSSRAHPQAKIAKGASRSRIAAAGRWLPTAPSNSLPRDARAWRSGLR